MASPLGFIALEAGWMVTELGRQPWTIYRIMRTSEAVTPATDVPTSFVAFTALYLFLAVALVVLLLRLAKSKLPAGEASDGA
jgi:cytochrome d ubiquinol oxidase subunit I